MLQKFHIAVIGSGISGLSAAWLLSQKHLVTLFEADQRIGGHSHTVDVSLKDGRRLPVDTGFIVSNTATYANFTALMDYLDVEMTDTKMSFSVSAADGGFEYNGDHLGNLLGGGRHWINPRRWRMVVDLVRFCTSAEKHAAELPEDLTLGEYLKQFGYSEIFVGRHILPIASAIWSSGPDVIARYPFQAFVAFFANHRLFELGQRQAWRTVKGGSRQYVERLVADGKFTILAGHPVTSVWRDNRSVEITTANGMKKRFDHVVVATHGDQALRLLHNPSDHEHNLLSCFKTSRNRAVLHRDIRFMPRRKRFWSAWNYHCAELPTELPAVTYWMNALQSLDTAENLFVSINPTIEPRPETIEREFVYRHPILTRQTLAAQKELWCLQGKQRTWFAGAWFGAGFHEDGLQAGLAVAEQLGGLIRPWDIASPSDRIHVQPVGPSYDPAYTIAAE